MIYVDGEYKCHASNPTGTYRKISTDIFDGMCDAYVEGYRYIPDGERWVRVDGVAFSGEMAAPWKDWRELDAAQRGYEREQLAAMADELADAKAALAILGVSADE